MYVCMYVYTYKYSYPVYPRIQFCTPATPGAPRSHLCRQPSAQCSAQPRDFNRAAQHCRTEDGGSGAQSQGPKQSEEDLWSFSLIQLGR